MSGKKENRGDATRMSIINAAGSLFAEKGFAATTIRDICAGADVNNAAVNYHFRDKENLFAEVVRYGFRAAHEKYPPDYNFENTERAEERLRQFIWNMLVRRYDKSLPSWFPPLMSRNMQFAHSHACAVLKKFKEKGRQVLSGILEDVSGHNPVQKNEIAAAGIIGPILYFLRPPHPDEKSPFPEFADDNEFELFIDRIYMFIMGGIEKMKEAE